VTIEQVPMCGHEYRNVSAKNCPNVWVHSISIDTNGRDLIWYYFTPDKARRLHSLSVRHFARMYRLVD